MDFVQLRTFSSLHSCFQVSYEICCLKMQMSLFISDNCITLSIVIGDFVVGRVVAWEKGAKGEVRTYQIKKKKNITRKNK